MITVSVLMPVYNASQFIAEAIESVIAQTYKDWELIVVDDQSIDGSYKIACDYALKDKRIKCYQLEQNSGSAQKPRLFAEEEAEGVFLTMLDADDILESSYIQKLIDRQQETDSDFVCSTIYSMAEDGSSSQLSIPSHSFDYSKVLSGKETYLKTICGWSISGQGLIRKSVANNARKNLDFPADNINADEVLTRLRLLLSSKVAFSDCIYYYRDNANSITKHFSTKYFGYMEATAALVPISEQHFGKYSLEYNLTMKQYFFAVIRSMRDYEIHNSEFAEEERYSIWTRILSHWYEVDRKALRSISKRLYLTHLLGPKLFSLRITKSK